MCLWADYRFREKCGKSNRLCRLRPANTLPGELSNVSCSLVARLLFSVVLGNTLAVVCE